LEKFKKPMFDKSEQEQEQEAIDGVLKKEAKLIESVIKLRSEAEETVAFCEAMLENLQ
jgi:hypothetical protein